MTDDNCSDRFQLPTRYKGQTRSVWEEYIKLAGIYKPIDLGQGYPDLPAPENITTALSEIASRDNIMMHQYTRGCGHMRLVKVLSKMYSQLLGRPVDPEYEILVSVGAYGALFSTIMGHIDHGDEVIIIEPFFDCYVPMVKTCGGTPIFVPLRSSQMFQISSSSSEWVLDPNELKGAFNIKTKAIIVNNPNNPLGKVYTEEELQLIADLCEKWNVLCISDEVYEWLVYKPKKHIRMASLPGMWDRTITVGSAGKTFNVTGWKIGWAYGPRRLVQNLHMVHQNSLYTCSTALQEALAIGFEIELGRLDKDDCLFNQLPELLQTKKNYIVKVMADLGLNPIIPDGGYFILVDFSSLAHKIDLSSESDKYLDMRFTKWLIKNLGVQFIPCTAFYEETHKPLAEHLLRICFIKDDAKLRAASDKLRTLKIEKQ